MECQQRYFIRVVITLLSHYWQGWGNAEKSLEAFWLEKTFYSHVLKANLRETCDSVHCKCTLSPGKEGREGHFLCLCHCIPSFSYKREELCISRAEEAQGDEEEQGASKDLLHITSCVHILHRLTDPVGRKLCLFQCLGKIPNSFQLLSEDPPSLPT